MLVENAGSITARDNGANFLNFSCTDTILASKTNPLYQMEIACGEILSIRATNQNLQEIIKVVVCGKYIKRCSKLRW